MNNAKPESEPSELVTQQSPTDAVSTPGVGEQPQPLPQAKPITVGGSDEAEVCRWRVNSPVTHAAETVILTRADHGWGYRSGIYNIVIRCSGLTSGSTVEKFEELYPGQVRIWCRDRQLELPATFSEECDERSDTHHAAIQFEIGGVPLPVPSHCVSSIAEWSGRPDPVAAGQGFFGSYSCLFDVTVPRARYILRTTYYEDADPPQYTVDQWLDELEAVKECITAGANPAGLLGLMVHQERLGRLTVVTTGKSAQPAAPDTIQAAGLRNEAVKPFWCPSTGRLSYLNDSKPLTAKAKRVLPVLDAFQAANWPSVIAMPRDLEKKKVGDVVDSLNRAIPFIRFTIAGPNKTIRWEYPSARNSTSGSQS